MKDKTTLNNAALKTLAIIFLCLIFFLFPKNIFALGIGPQINFSAGTDFENPLLEGGISCSLKTDNIPLSFGIATDWNFSENTFETYATGDLWIFNPMISDYASFFLGPGGMIGASFWNGGLSFNAAPRIVFGLNWILYDGFLEYFLQSALQGEFSFGSENGFALKIPCNFGVRFYF